MQKFHQKLKFSIFFVVLLSLSVPQYIFAQTNPNANVEASIRQYFADIPAMITIAKCESGFREFASDGTALYDPSHTYVGAFQVDERLHFMDAWALGWNLSTLEGNMAYARHLYEQSGTTPWTCAPTNKTTASLANSPTPTTTVNGTTITSILRAGMTSSQVLLLQQLLNKNGFTIAASGVGSAGNETNYFGSLTRLAVQRFQCAKQIVCSGDEATTGYGRVGPNTRAALNQLSL